MKTTIRMLIEELGYQYDAKGHYYVSGRIVTGFDDNVLNVFVFTDSRRYLVQFTATFTESTPPEAIKAFLNAIG